MENLQNLTNEQLLQKLHDLNEKMYNEINSDLSGSNPSDAVKDLLLNIDDVEAEMYDRGMFDSLI